MAFPSRVIEETKCGLWYIHPTKKRRGISRGVQDRATPGGISVVLVFDLGISNSVTQFCRFCRGESLFSPEFLCDQ